MKKKYISLYEFYYPKYYTCKKKVIIRRLLSVLGFRETMGAIDPPLDDFLYVIEKLRHTKMHRYNYLKSKKFD